METLEQDIGALAQDIVQREAEARTAYKAWRLEKPPEQARLEGRQQTFRRWCADELAIEVRRADAALAPARYRVAQLTPQVASWRWSEVCAQTVVAHVEIVLARDYTQHVLTVTLCGDGAVSSVHRTATGTVMEVPPARSVQELNADYARALVLKFVTRATHRESSAPSAGAS